MNTANGRPMVFRVERVADGEDASRWHWSVHSHPDLALLRDGQVAGDLDQAERAARAAIANMGGTALAPDRCRGVGAGGAPLDRGREA